MCEGLESAHSHLPPLTASLQTEHRDVCPWLGRSPEADRDTGMLPEKVHTSTPTPRDFTDTGVGTSVPSPLVAQAQTSSSESPTEVTGKGWETWGHTQVTHTGSSSSAPGFPPSAPPHSEVLITSFEFTEQILNLE